PPADSQQAAAVEPLVVDLQIAQQPLEERSLISAVENGELRRQPQRLMLLADDLHSEGVERAHRHPAGLGRPAGEREDALAHLGRRLVGERDREDGATRQPLPEQMNDPMGDDERLARPGAGQDQHGSVGLADRLALLRIEEREIERHPGTPWYPAVQERTSLDLAAEA